MMMKMDIYTKLIRFNALFVILLFSMLPVASALSMTVDVRDRTLNSAEILITASEPVDYKIDYGLSETYDKLLQSTEKILFRNITLLNLAQAKTYFYNITSCADSCLNKQGNFTLLSIENVQKTNITSRTAIIGYATNKEADTEIWYGTDKENLNLTLNDTNKVYNHSIKLENLTPGTRYYFKVVSNNVTNDRQTLLYDFYTERDIIEGFIQLHSLPEYINSNLLTLTGTTEPNSDLKFFVNDASIRSLITNIGQFEYRTNQSGFFNATIRLQPGFNTIKIVQTDPDFNPYTKFINVTVDLDVPVVESAAVNQWRGIDTQYIPVKGKSSKNVTIKATVIQKLNETDWQIISRDQDIPVDAEGKFDSQIKFTGEGVFLLNMTASDRAGNIVRSIQEFYVDLTAPTLAFDAAPTRNFSIGGGSFRRTFFEYTNEHFPVRRVKGVTEPYAKVFITNVGDLGKMPLSQVDQVSMSDLMQALTNYTREYQEMRYQNWDTYASERLTYIRAGKFGLLGSIVKYSKEVTADAEGNFDATIALTEGYNNIIIDVYDRANNYYQLTLNLNLELGSHIWTLVKVSTIPNEVYTSDLTHQEGQSANGADVGLIAEFAYNGPYGNELQGVNVNIMTEGAKNDNKYIRMDSKVTAHFNPQTNRLVAFTKIKVLPLIGGIETYPDELQLALIGHVTYRYPASIIGSLPAEQRPTGAEKVFLEAAIAVEKPFKLTKWLSPEQINSTIEKLDKMIEFVDKGIEIFDKLAKVSFGACVAWSFVSLLGGMNDPAIFAVCDRVGCPDIPPDCGSMNKQGTFKVDGKDTTLVSGKDGKWYDPSKPAGSPAVEIGTQQPIDGSLTRFTQTGGTNVRMQVVTTGISPEENLKLSQCTAAGGTLIRTLSTGNPANFIITGISSAQGAVSSADPRSNTQFTTIDTAWHCAYDTNDQGQQIPLSEKRFMNLDLGRVQQGVTFKGCYQAQAPNYDEYKCWPQLWGPDAKGINPAEGFFTSLKCNCFSGSKSHLTNVNRILNGMKKCLQQAYMGNVQGGYCERLLSQFACDIFVGILKLALKKQIEPQLSTATGANNGRTPNKALQQTKKNQETITSQLNSRYQGTFKSAFGLGKDQIVHKMCIGALSGDWSAMEDMMNVVTRIPVAPVIGPMMPEARQSVYNPFTGTIDVNYHITVGILSGGQDVNYEVILSCDPSYTTPNYCPKSVKVPDYVVQGFVPADGSKEENAIYTQQNANYIYNKATLKVKYMLGEHMKEQVVSEQINLKGGLIKQCQFTLLPSPGITCETLPGMVGAIEWRDPNIVPDIGTYYPGNKVYFKADMRKFGQTDKAYFYWRIDKESKEFASGQVSVDELTTLDDFLRPTVFELMEFKLGEVTQVTEQVKEFTFTSNNEIDNNFQISFQKKKTTATGDTWETFADADKSKITSVTVTTDKGEFVLAGTSNKLKWDNQEIKFDPYPTAPNAVPTKVTKITVKLASTTETIQMKVKTNSQEHSFEIQPPSATASSKYPDGSYDITVGIFRDDDNDQIIKLDKDSALAYDNSVLKETFKIHYQSKLPDANKRPVLDIVSPGKEDYFCTNSYIAFIGVDDKNNVKKAEVLINAVNLGTIEFNQQEKANGFFVKKVDQIPNAKDKFNQAFPSLVSNQRAVMKIKIYDDAGENHELEREVTLAPETTCTGFKEPTLEKTSTTISPQASAAASPTTPAATGTVTFTSYTNAEAGININDLVNLKTDSRTKDIITCNVVDCNVRADMVSKIVSASSAIKAKWPTASLQINSAFRTLEKQQELFDASDKSGTAVATPSKNAPHVTGFAIDVRVSGLDLGEAKLYQTTPDPFTAQQKTNHRELREIMKAADFVGYQNTEQTQGEWWHFECCGTDRYNRARSAQAGWII